MEKVVIQVGAGEFKLPAEVREEYLELSGRDERYLELMRMYGVTNCFRTDPILIDIIELRGGYVPGDIPPNGLLSYDPGYMVKTIPDGYRWSVDNHAGSEWIEYHVKEDYLRKVIQTGSEDDIVNYVMKRF